MFLAFWTYSSIILAAGYVLCAILSDGTRIEERQKAHENGYALAKEEDKLEITEAVNLALGVVEAKAYARGVRATEEAARAAYRKKLARMRKNIYIGNGWNTK